MLCIIIIHISLDIILNSPIYIISISFPMHRHVVVAKGFKNGSDHAVVASYSELYEKGAVLRGQRSWTGYRKGSGGDEGIRTHAMFNT